MSGGPEGGVSRERAERLHPESRAVGLPRLAAVNPGHLGIVVWRGLAGGRLTPWASVRLATESSCVFLASLYAVPSPWNCVLRATLAPRGGCRAGSRGASYLP